MTIKIPRELTTFVTPEGIGSFLSLFPGQAQDSFNSGSKAYRIEMGFDAALLDADRQRILQGGEAQEPMIKAVALVAKTFDPADWMRHVFGPFGRFRKLAETQRDSRKYSYYADKYIATFSQVHSLRTLGMKDANLAEPGRRQQFEQALAARAPGVRRLANPNSPQDVQRIQELNKERALTGAPAVPETDYGRTLIAALPYEVWPGCYFRVYGRAYWNAFAKPATVHLALMGVLMTRQGDRLVGDDNPDAALADVAVPAVDDALSALL